ncbi:MAG: hypothetical protein HYX69_18130 [Planctomycetia bacterium]|nr:hypothetical protein [Planctomycetia bacterium]
MLILTQFVLRLSWGLAAAMTLVPPRQVTSGYYRNNLYVLLGLNVLVALVTATARTSPASTWLPAVAAATSYAGAVLWLYERPRAGIVALAALAALDLAAAWIATPSWADGNAAARALAILDPLTGGLLLGTTMAAMLLGHWYLNAPGMPLAPLGRLIVVLAAAVVLRAVVCGWGLALEVSGGTTFDAAHGLFLALRWLGGLVATGALALMARATLKIPNTQSATGILYVAVITTFLGELASALLSAQSGYPL